MNPTERKRTSIDTNTPCEEDVVIRSEDAGIGSKTSGCEPAVDLPIEPGWISGAKPAKERETGSRSGSQNNYHTGSQSDADTLNNLCSQSNVDSCGNTGLQSKAKNTGLQNKTDTLNNTGSPSKADSCGNIGSQNNADTLNNTSSPNDHHQQNGQPAEWFAARTRKGQELSTRNALVKLGIEYYLPTKVEIRQLKYRKKRVEVPLIKNLIFIHATKQEACDIPNKQGLKIYYMTSLETRRMLVVPDKQMRDFMFLTNLSPEGLSIDEEQPFAVGTKVKVIKGDLAGIEGILTTINNNTYVTLCLQGILTATVKVPRSYLRVGK